MGRTLVAVDKNGAIAENALGADSFLVLKDGQLEKTFKNDIDGMKPAQLERICTKLGIETFISGDMMPKLSLVRMVKMDAGTSPAWREEEYSRNKIDEMWHDIVNPLLEGGGSVVIQPMPEGDVGRLAWRDGQIRFEAEAFSTTNLGTSQKHSSFAKLSKSFAKYWPQLECTMNVILQNDIVPEIAAYDLSGFDKEDYGQYSYIERLAKLEKILKNATHISLIGGKVLWPEASFDEFKEAIAWGFTQKDVAHIAVRDLGAVYEKPVYLEKGHFSWRVVAPPTRTLLDVLGHPFKVLRELREE